MKRAAGPGTAPLSPLLTAQPHRLRPFSSNSRAAPRASM
jgi:hypothetical protein